MTRIKRIAALTAAVASFAAVAATPASAQEIYIAPPPCDNVPGCVNYALDTVEDLRQYVEDFYNDTVQPAVDDVNCDVHYVITGNKCDED